MMFLSMLIVVATLAGGNERTIGVACNVRADPGVEGYAMLEAGVVHLQPKWCDALRDPTVDGYAALVLGHEVGHIILQTRDEAKAECWGLHHVPQIARLLGWNPRKALAEARYRSYCRG